MQLSGRRVKTTHKRRFKTGASGTKSYSKLRKDLKRKRRKIAKMSRRKNRK